MIVDTEYKQQDKAEEETILDPLMGHTKLYLGPYGRYKLSQVNRFFNHFAKDETKDFNNAYLKLDKDIQLLKLALRPSSLHHAYKETFQSEVYRQLLMILTNFNALFLDIAKPVNNRLLERLAILGKGAIETFVRKKFNRQYSGFHCTHPAVYQSTATLLDEAAEDILVEQDFIPVKDKLRGGKLRRDLSTTLKKAVSMLEHGGNIRQAVTDNSLPAVERNKCNIQ